MTVAGGVTARCERCGFHPLDWTAQDAARTFRHLRTWWEQVSPGAMPSEDERWVRSSQELSGGGEPPSAARLQELHHQLHAISAAGRVRHARGDGAPTATGTVVAVNASSGGVPKVAVLEGVVGWGGLEGDVQAARAHHGRPWQALCLWSADVIDALREEGHPIAAGCAGENLTVAGIDWATIRPGARVQAGEVLAEVSLWAVPCQKNARWFIGGDFDRMSHERQAGISRMYATVLRPGRVRAGDALVVEPG